MADNKKSGGVLLIEEELDEIKKAIEEDDCSKLLNYIDKGWDVNQRLRYRTALHLAAGKGRTEVVRVLLQGGADVDVRDMEGRTPLHMAAWWGHTDTVKVLLANKASVDVRDVGGRTPLHRAAGEGDTDTVKELLANKASVDVCDKWMGWTLLHMAALCGHTDTVKELLANKASVDVRDEWRGRTPLHWAARHGHTDTVKVLLANKASVDVRDEWQGDTPLHKASARGHTEVVKLLCMESQCDVTAVNKDKETALDVCGRGYTASKDEVKRIKTILKKHMDLKRDLKKLEKKHGCAIEVRPAAVKRTTVGSSDHSSGAFAVPTEEQCGAVVEGFAKSKGKIIPEGQADVIFKVKRGNDGALDILGVDARLSDYFPLIQPPSPPTASTTLFHDVNKKVMLAHLHQSLARALPSVVLLATSDGNGLGSGFRVGPTYVMTNCHVVKALSDPLGSNAVLFHFNKSLMQSLNQGIIQAAPILSVIARDEDLDIAVLDLDFHAALAPAFNLCKRINNHSLPLELTRFKAIVGQEYVHFAGHPDGQEKVLDTQCKIDHITDGERTKLLELHRRSNNVVFKTVADTRRVLYQSSSKFGNGSSGSPGFVADDHQEACLAVMHTSGHNMVLPPGEFRLNTVEQGVRIECIYDFISQQDARLCRLIFPGGRPT